jgi:hypothetical protein
MATFGMVASAESANVCGTLNELRMPTTNVAGSVVVGAERFAIATNARRTMDPAAKVGTQVCLTGTWIGSQTVGRELSDFTLAPQRLATAAPTTGASVGTLPSTTTTSNSAAPDQTVAVLLIALLVILALGGVGFALSRLRAR